MRNIKKLILAALILFTVPAFATGHYQKHERSYREPRARKDRQPKERKQKESKERSGGKRGRPRKQ
jgi:hypothetical protein